MKKSDFLKELDEIIFDRIFIGSSALDLENEIAQNGWSISMDQDLVNKFTTEDLISFFLQVQNSRKEQVVKTSDHDMIFYLWFDHQSAALRFNLISDFHKKLPFRCKYDIIQDMEPILDDFLQFHYHDGFPIAEADEYEIADGEIEFTPLNVYSLTITTK